MVHFNYSTTNGINCNRDYIFRERCQFLLLAEYGRVISTNPLIIGRREEKIILGRLTKICPMFIKLSDQ
jgi:hypothetical protein